MSLVFSRNVTIVLDREARSACDVRSSCSNPGAKHSARVVLSHTESGVRHTLRYCCADGHDIVQGSPLAKRSKTCMQALVGIRDNFAIE